MTNETARLDREEQLLKSQTMKLSGTLTALVVGLLFGVAIFVATNWIVLQGGHVTEEGERVVGPHLQLLGQFFIGYSVSFVGSLIGFVYGVLVGGVTGWLFSAVYNKVAALRE